jgi:hypothetical protein
MTLFLDTETATTLTPMPTTSVSHQTTLAATSDPTGSVGGPIETPVFPSTIPPANWSNHPIDYSGWAVELRLLAQTPKGHNTVNSMTTRPGDDSGLYVSTQDGYIYRVEENPDGTSELSLWFDVGEAIEHAGPGLYYKNPQTGLQSVAFHPNFDKPNMPGFGKLFTSLIENASPDSPGDLFLGNSLAQPGTAAVSALVEWTFNEATGEVDPASYRPLFRVQSPQPRLLHMIKQAKFNPFAQLGDPDYGLLYVTHGDASDEPGTGAYAQDLGSALGKVLRIQPLQAGELRYEIPPTNPLADATDEQRLGEIYAYGFRNPHTFSFNPDENGQVHILLGDIGRNNVEEVNLVVAGKNYGWPYREGPYVHRGLPDSNVNGGYLTGVSDLPADEAELPMTFTYPVALFYHQGESSQVLTGNAIATGDVVEDGQFLFADFARGGDLFHADFSELLKAVTELDPHDVSRHQPHDLTQAHVSKLYIFFDDDDDPQTELSRYDNLLDFFYNTRSDVRFGRGPNGPVMSTKLTGRIYTLHLWPPESR